MRNTSTETEAEWMRGWSAVWDELSRAFPGERTDQLDPDFYAKYLGDLDIDVIEAAARQCIACRPYPTFPTIGEIRETASALLECRYPSAIEAWDEVRRFLGTGEPLKFVWSNPLAKRCCEAMDVYALRHSDKPSVDRAHFLQAYDGLLQRAKAEARLVPQARAILEAARLTPLALPGDSRLALAEAPKSTIAGLVRVTCEGCGASGLAKPDAPQPFICRGCRDREWLVAQSESETGRVS